MSAIRAVTFVCAGDREEASASTAKSKSEDTNAEMNKSISIKKSWRKTYYKAINKKDYVKITFRKSSYIVQLVQKKKKVRTIERGNYLTGAS